LLPGTLFVVTIAYAALAIFVIALVIACTLLSFTIACRHGRVVINTLSPATAHL
jgi:hypothetical protein